MHAIPEDQLIRIANVINMTSLSRGQVYIMEDRGEFPQRIPFFSTAAIGIR